MLGGHKVSLEDIERRRLLDVKGNPSVESDAVERADDTSVGVDMLGWIRVREEESETGVRRLGKGREGRSEDRGDSFGL